MSLPSRVRALVSAFLAAGMGAPHPVEAQAEAGQNEAALRSYRRSLELDPENRRAAEQIEKLSPPR